MIQLRFSHNKNYSLVGPINYRRNRIELYLLNYSDDIDYSKGFEKWFVPEPPEFYERKDIEMPEPRLLQDFSTYRYKWNVLTPMTNGIVLTDDPNNVETESDNFHPLTDESIETINKDIQKIDEEDKKQQDAAKQVEDRISALEAELAELKSK